MLLAVPAIPEGGGQAEELAQRSTLRTAFITYLQLKGAAGIINIDGPQVRRRRASCFWSYLGYLGNRYRGSCKRRHSARS